MKSMLICLSLVAWTLGCNEPFEEPIDYSNCPPAYEECPNEWDIMCEKPWTTGEEYYDGEKMADGVRNLLEGSYIADSCSGRTANTSEINQWCANIKENL